MSRGTKLDCCPWHHPKTFLMLARLYIRVENVSKLLANTYKNLYSISTKKLNLDISLLNETTKVDLKLKSFVRMVIRVMQQAKNQHSSLLDLSRYVNIQVFITSFIITYFMQIIQLRKIYFFKNIHGSSVGIHLYLRELQGSNFH